MPIFSSKTNEEITTNEYVYKILVVGDSGCGKTSIIRRYVKNEFSTEYTSTVCLQHKIYIIDWSRFRIKRNSLGH